MDVSETQDVSNKIILTVDDKSRIENCDFYSRAKSIIQSTIDYRDYEVGTAVYIRRISDGSFITTDYESKNKEKYIIVQNDNGFLFAKRINASGKPGVTIVCLTIEYGSHYYELQVDDAYVEAMLLDTQDVYDPTTDAKNLAKRKNKASRDNSKKRVLFDTDAEAYAYIKTLSVGDVIWESCYSYGDRISEYKVSSIESRPTKPSTGTGWSRTYGDDDYINNGFTEVIVVKMSVMNSTARYKYDRDITYHHLSKPCQRNMFFYREKPVSPEDLAV